MCDTSLNGLLQNLMILVWLKWVSDVKNSLIHVHHCAVNNTLQFSPWTELTEKSTSCERHHKTHNKNRRKVWQGLSDGFHLSFQRDTSIIVSPIVYQTFVGKYLQKYRMLQCPKYGHTTISQSILYLDLIRCSCCSFFFAAL